MEGSQGYMIGDPGSKKTHLVPGQPLMCTDATVTPAKVLLNSATASNHNWAHSLATVSLCAPQWDIIHGIKDVYLTKVKD